MNCGCNSIQSIATGRNSIQSIATGCNSIQISIELPIATGCNSIESIATLNCRLRMGSIEMRGALPWRCAPRTTPTCAPASSSRTSSVLSSRRVARATVIRAFSLRWDSQRSSSGRGARACRVACQCLGSLCLLCLEKITKGIK